MQAKNQAYIKKCHILSFVHAKLYTGRCVSIALPRLYRFAYSLRLAKPRVFWLLPCSQILPFKDIVAFWDSLHCRTFSDALYEMSTLDGYEKASRNVACEGHDKLTKRRFLLLHSENLYIVVFSVASYEVPMLDNYGEASRNVACDSPDKLTKRLFFLQCPAPSVIPR
jgi:hypothetical protein